MRVLILGGNGQLSRGLAASAPMGADVVSHDIDTLDITDSDAVRALMAEVQPELVLNAAAYTAVDKAEGEEALALAVNGTAVGIPSAAAREAQARFVHVSTDFVFDGTSGIPYRPAAAPNPLGAYGRTKRVGEELAGPDALIVRTAWVYEPTGGNFVGTMLRLIAERPEIRVVADQIGTPTYAPGLAQALWALAAKGVTGIHHYTNSGAASWYDFAVAIQEEAPAVGLLDKEVSVLPIATSDYPTPAQRPHFSVLDKRFTFEALGKPAPHWRVNLRTMLREVAGNA